MRYLFISNRLPFTLSFSNSSPTFTESSGGLSSALKSYVSSIQNTDKNAEYLWVGWPGAPVKNSLRETIATTALHRYHSLPVFLNLHDIELYYNGFCNQTLWPLFHYFPSYTAMKEDYWSAYQRINELFAKTIVSIIRPDDILLIQDYHLLLLPQLIRRHNIHNPIGFFLHIPFPTLDIYRILPLPWQQKILQGLLGANLIGFHTVSYQNNFLNSVTALLGQSHTLGSIQTSSHTSQTGVFPISIDYKYFSKQSRTISVQTGKKKLKKQYKSQKVIVSVDRLDYSKEIFNRLKGYALFLKRHPLWKNRIVFHLTLIPSRSDIDTYQQTKDSILHLIDSINHQFGTAHWKPIYYEYNSVPPDTLLALYTAADIALITPARDGMNLVAKEFVASRFDKKGVLILSKFAGASHELPGAVFINPYYPHSIAQGIEKALTFDSKEQQYRMQLMQPILKRYTISDWAYTFNTALQEAIKNHDVPIHHKNGKFFYEYDQAKKRLLLFDYDGTLVPLAATPEKAVPSSEVITLLYKLSQDSKNHVVIISGRDKQTLSDWLGWLPITISAEHGVWVKPFNHNNWTLTHPLSDLWKEKVRTYLTHYSTGIPNSFIEEKDYSIAFHYRMAPQKLAEVRINYMKYELQTFIANSSLEVLHGNKVIEIKSVSVNKGVAAFQLLQQQEYDFILAAGDDTTDEDLFSVLPPSAFTIKIGELSSRAQFRFTHPDRLLKLLEILSFKSEFPRRQAISH